MTTTVRRTSTKRLNAILADAALITKYRDMETDVDIGAVSAKEQAMSRSTADLGVSVAVLAIE